MLRRIIVLSIGILSNATLFADATPSPQPYNNPNVNSLAASNQQFPSENKLTGKKNQAYNSPQAQELNKPTVNSFAASSQLYPQQNQLTGKKNQKYYTQEQMKNKKNNPTVNSRLASSELFPEQDSFNNDGKTVKKPPNSSAGK